MLNRFCITDSCTIEPAPKCFCITDSCTIEPVLNRLCRTDSCTIEPVLNRSCITVSCTNEPVPNRFCINDSCIIEPVHNRFCITDSCTIEPVLNRAVSNRYGARLFSCTIGPCLIGRAESEPCKIVPCLIDTIPLSTSRVIKLLQYETFRQCLIVIWQKTISHQSQTSMNSKYGGYMMLKIRIYL